MFLIVLLNLPVFGQSSDSLIRQSEIEKFTEKIYSVKELHRVADSLQITVNELSDYPIIFPIKKTHRISSGFGMRKHPITKVRQFHTGIDIPQPKGTAVYATGNGIVSRKGYNSGYGYFVEIEHASNFRSFYAHLSKTMVTVGDSVRIAEQIACVGSTGISTGNHLHYEVRKGNRFLNPIEWCYCLFEVFKDEFTNRKTA
jgi:murein DD-endopeptidase MepM/ murein hydrolase activator NlpD